MVFRGNSRGRGTPDTVAHFEDRSKTTIKPGASLWASITEIDFTTKLPINGDAYLFVQQVVPAYEDGIVDVSVWIDNVPDAINWQCNLYISQEWG